MDNRMNLTISRETYSGGSVHIPATVELFEGKVINIISWDNSFSGDWDQGDLNDCQDVVDTLLLTSPQTVTSRLKVG